MRLARLAPRRCDIGRFNELEGEWNPRTIEFGFCDMIVLDTPHVNRVLAERETEGSKTKLAIRIGSRRRIGIWVAVNVEFSAAGGEGPVQIQYSIADSSAVAFQQGQVERLEIRDRSDIKRQQLTVIPQREGRVYVNVSAEVETENGTMIKSMAIPIQVGNAPNRPTTNGEVVEGPDGEQVISLPASENQ